MLLWLAAALMGCAEEVDCETLSVDEVGMNHAVMSWTPLEGASTRVDYSWSSDTLSTPAGEGAHTLLGLAAGQSISYTAVTIDGDRESTCEGTLTTDALASRYPELSVTVNEPSLQSDEQYVMGSFVSDPTAIYTIDRDGDLVWFQTADAERLISQSSRVMGSTDVIYNDFDSSFTDTTATLRRVSVTGEVVSEMPAYDHHHSFTQLPDGSIAYIRMDVREWYDKEEDETVDVAGDWIIEVAADGTEREIFSTWDAFEPVKHDLWGAVFYTDAKDWAHANSLRYNESSDTYLMSMGYSNIVVEVERETGEVVRFFGEGSDYAFAGDSTPFDYQHSPHYTDDGTLLMTSVAGDGIHAIEYAIDDTNKTLTEVWSHAKDEGHLVFAMGHVQRLSNGNTLMSFGSGARIREVTPDNEIAWEVRLSQNSLVLFGDLTAFDDFYSAE